MVGGTLIVVYHDAFGMRLMEGSAEVVQADRPPHATLFLAHAHPTPINHHTTSLCRIRAHHLNAPVQRRRMIVMNACHSDECLSGDAVVL
jgi:hypothetical protein